MPDAHGGTRESWSELISALEAMSHAAAIAGAELRASAVGTELFARVAALAHALEQSERACVELRVSVDGQPKTMAPRRERITQVRSQPSLAAVRGALRRSIRGSSALQR